MGSQDAKLGWFFDYFCFLIFYQVSISYAYTHYSHQGGLSIVHIYFTAAGT